MYSTCESIENTDYPGVDSYKVLESHTSWNSTKINGSLIFYKISTDSSLPRITASVKLLQQNSGIVVYYENQRLDLKTIENKTDNTFEQITSDKIKSLLKYLDSFTEETDLFDLVLENFESNIVEKYPKSKYFCRFCFCKDDGGSCRLEPITLDLMRAFNSLTNIDLSVDVELPSKCCQPCSYAITLASTTQQLVTKCERKLIKFHKEMKRKMKDVEDSCEEKEEPEMVTPDTIAPVKVEIPEEYYEEEEYSMPNDSLDTEESRPSFEDEDPLPPTAKRRKFTEEDGYR